MLVRRPRTIKENWHLRFFAGATQVTHVYDIVFTLFFAWPFKYTGNSWQGWKFTAQHIIADIKEPLS